MSAKRTFEDTGWEQLRALQRAASGPQPETKDSPGSAGGSPDETEELSTGITGDEPIREPPVSPRVIEELREEIESLEAVVDQLDGEKHALKMRLSEVDNLRRFSMGDCKKWLASNFEFDRKDTPELLAGIFENYLLQSDALEPLPHQLLIKNSARAQSRRDKIAVARFTQYQRKDKGAEEVVVALPKPKRQARQAIVTAATATATGTSDAGAYGQFLYVSPDAIEELYATKPWLLFLDQWPKLRPGGKASNYDALVRLQDEFLEKNAVAIWERSHWFPIKMENGKTAQETKMLGRHHNRRKRRQAQLKERLEALNVELKSQFERVLLDQSVFGNRWVGIIMQRPMLWIPREDESLVDQLRELDEAEPQRNHHFVK